MSQGDSGRTGGGEVEPQASTPASQASPTPVSQASPTPASQPLPAPASQATAAPASQPTALVAESHRVPGRGRYDEAARRERLAWISQRTQVNLEALSQTRLVPERLSRNIENMIGAVEVPVGLAGPLLIHHQGASDIVYAPFATTEGALVASASRGATAITRAGGVTVEVLRQRMTRAPSFEFASAAAAARFAAWIEGQRPALQERVGEVSRHTELIDLVAVVDGELVHTLFVYSTGDAAGQNMTTTATWRCCQWTVQQLPRLDLPLVRLVLEGNMSGDKKVSLQSERWARGTAVTAVCRLDAETVRNVLKIELAEILAYYRISLSAAHSAKLVNNNANIANVVAAIFTATGQDIACVHESSLGTLELAAEGEYIRASMTMRGLAIGTVGGGTHLPAQRALLESMGCVGEGSSARLAGIIAGFALALDLSTLAAMLTGEFAAAHERLGRNRPVKAFGEAELDASFFSSMLRTSLSAPQLEVTGVEKLAASAGSSILSDYAARRLGKQVGLHHRRLHHDLGHTDVVVKLKPLDAELILLMQGVAASCGEQVAQAHARFAPEAGFAGSHLRELGVYGQQDERFTRHAPRLYGSHRDDTREAYLLVLERLDGLRLMDSADDSGAWTSADIAAAITGAAAFHAIWLGREAELLRVPWLGLPPTAERMTRLTPLWSALAEHAAKEFPHLMHPDQLDRHLELIATIPDWWARLEAMPRTLIHNDFNPRNIAIRGSGRNARLCAYDWELATLHLPQHDLAELLAFVLPTDPDAAEIGRLIELHRRAVAEAGGSPPDAGTWRAGFFLAVRDLLVNRFGFYLMGYTTQQWRFLERALTTLRALLALERA